MKKYFNLVLYIWWASCQPPFDPSKMDILLDGVPIQFGRTSLNSIQSQFSVEPCDAESGDESEGFYCYYTKWSSSCSQLGPVNLALTFKDSVLISITLSTCLNKGYTVSKPELNRIVEEHFRVKTHHLNQLIESGWLKQSQWEERCWIYQNPNGVFIYYTAG